MEKDTRAAPPRSLADSELEDLERALRAASPAPWQTFPVEYVEGKPTRAVDLTGSEDGLPDRTIIATNVDREDGVLCAAIRNAAPSLISDLRSARKLLGRWSEADHCHGHICDSDPDGPCEVRRLEDETRAFRGNADASPPPDSSAALLEARRLLQKAESEIGCMWGSPPEKREILAEIRAFLRSDSERSEPGKG